MFKNIKSGSITLEASIILPLIVIGLLTIGSLIIFNTCEENIYSSAMDEGRKLAIDSYMEIGKAEALLFTNRVENRLREENRACSYIEITDFDYLYRNRYTDKLISYEIEYGVSPKVPIKFCDAIKGKDRITLRAFVGSDNYRINKGYDLFEEEEESIPVWVFPSSGIKYHKKECRYVTAAAKRTKLDGSIKMQFDSCKLCHSKDLKNGANVYVYTNSGKVFHRGECKKVDKYVVEIQKVEAEKRGYAPCSVCGGA